VNEPSATCLIGPQCCAAPSWLQPTHNKCMHIDKYDIRLYKSVIDILFIRAKSPLYRTIYALKCTVNNKLLINKNYQHLTTGNGKRIIPGNFKQVITKTKQLTNVV
jgi:hypothetical protein